MLFHILLDIYIRFLEHINTEIESKLVDKLPEEFKILEDPRKVRKLQNNLLPNHFFVLLTSCLVLNLNNTILYQSCIIKNLVYCTV